MYYSEISSSWEIAIFNVVMNIDNRRTTDKRSERRFEENRGRKIDLSLSRFSLSLFLG